MIEVPARTVFVGGTTVPVSSAEWFLSTLPPGTPIEWEGAVSRSGLDGIPADGAVVLLGTYYYDGVVANVAVGGKRYGMYPDHYKDGFDVRLLADPRRLNDPSMDGGRI